MKKFILLTIFLFLFFFSVPSTHAAEVGLATTKSLYDLEIVPGSAYEDSIVVFNRSKELALPVHMELTLWDIDEDTEEMKFILAEPALNATKWFSVGIVKEQGAKPALRPAEEVGDFILDVDEAREMRFRVSPPADVSPGSYFVMMRFQAVLPPHYFTDDPVAPHTIPEIGVLFFIKVGFATLEGEGSGYNAEVRHLLPKDTPQLGVFGGFVPGASAGIYEEMVRAFTTKIFNSGLYHFKASGHIEIQNMFGAQVARADLPDRYLLPRRTRTFDVSMGKDDPSFFERFLHLGPYTAVMVLNVPEHDLPIIYTAHFWAFPWKLVTPALFFAGILILLRRRLVAAIRVLMRR